MHAALGLTLLHDSYLLPSPSVEQSIRMALHIYKSAALMNLKLSSKMTTSECDVLWLAAALQGALSFADIHIHSAEDAWPLKSSSELDLHWLTMSEGKEAVRKFVNPETSAFRTVLEEFQEQNKTYDELRDKIFSLPPQLIRLLSLDITPIPTSHPYYHVALVLAELLPLECNGSTILKFIRFITSFDSKFKDLLRIKDPTALLLLAYWYAKILDSHVWWMRRRSYLECQAICLYLQRYHSDDRLIQELVSFPQEKCWHRYLHISDWENRAD
jgi:hypothetical protein